MNADEIIVHSTGSFCIPVKTVDGKPVGGKAPEMLKKYRMRLLPTLRNSAKQTDYLTDDLRGLL